MIFRYANVIELYPVSNLTDSMTALFIFVQIYYNIFRSKQNACTLVLFLALSAPSQPSIYAILVHIAI